MFDLVMAADNKPLQWRISVRVIHITVFHVRHTWLGRMVVCVHTRISVTPMSRWVLVCYDFSKCNIYELPICSLVPDETSLATNFGPLLI